MGPSVSFHSLSHKRRGHRASARPYKIDVVSEMIVDPKFSVGSACLSWIMSLSNGARAAPGVQTATHRPWAMICCPLAATRPSREGLRSSPPPTPRRRTTSRATPAQEREALQNRCGFGIGRGSEIFCRAACLSWIMGLSNGARAAPGDPRTGDPSLKN